MFINFTLALTGGTLAVLATGRFGQIAWKFLRLVSFLVLALACTATLWHWRVSNDGIAASGGGAIVQVSGGAILFVGRGGLLLSGGVVALAALALAVMAPLASRYAAAVRLICAIGGLVGIAGACVAVLQLPPDGGTGENTIDGHALVRIMLITGEILAAALLGSMTVAWLLGHAYLTATRMTIEPLRHFSRLVSWTVAARAGFAACSAGLAWYFAGSTGPGASGALSNALGPLADASGALSNVSWPLADVWGQLAGAWLIVSLRVGVGLIGVGVFAYMVADCVRLRSTQSATGILYFGSIFAFIGELAALQLVAECGWPL